MKTKLVFLLCLSVSIVMMVAGFIIPPTGVIDGSVLKASGELLGFAALALGARAVDEKLSTSIRHGDTEITVKPQIEEKTYEEGLDDNIN